MKGSRPSLGKAEKKEKSLNMSLTEQSESEKGYWLVLLRGDAVPTDEVNQAHVDFIDDLIRSNSILLGGGFSGVEGIPGGYLLYCESETEARSIAASDPYVKEGPFGSDILEWPLVGINPEAILASKIVRPSDV